MCKTTYYMGYNNLHDIFTVLKYLVSHSGLCYEYLGGKHNKSPHP